jgi:quercetin dioxygenase-like cupin family protein
MPFIDTNQLKTIERIPGWKGRYFDSNSMTFGHYVFEAGSTIHEHQHPNEEVWNVIEGQLEVTIGGKTQVAGPGCVAMVPPDTDHFVRAVTDGRAIVVDYPQRAGFADAKPATSG